MQMRIEARKKMRKLRSASRLNASAPRMSRNCLRGWPLATGGVFGSVKLYNPNIREAQPHMMNVFLNAPRETEAGESQANR
jgi:hypothetical protein